MSKAVMDVKKDRVFLDFFNSKEVYSIKGFDTVRKAKNYAKKFDVAIFEKMPDNIGDFQYDN